MSALPWFKLYTSAAFDPKLLVVSARSGQPVAVAGHVWLMMLCHAGERLGDERGTLSGWHDEVAAAFLGVEATSVAAVRAAMDGVLLRGDVILAWHRRQGVAEGRYSPTEAGTSTNRVRAYRARKAAAKAAEADQETPETPSFGTMKHGEAETHRGQDTKTLERKDADEEGKMLHSASPLATTEPQDRHAPGRKASGVAGSRGERLPDDWAPSRDHDALAAELGVDVFACAAAFRDHWMAEAGSKAHKLNWDAAFRGWLRREAGFRAQRSQRVPGQDQRAAELRVASAMLDAMGAGQHGVLP